ncbi:response regulator [Klebsiella sp. BIGb0407]|uniref:response regulator n=1 Tax=Klebsiella sp. BIGb0407 TaxID=2940603 RepID=UPI002167988B|nr:response regulator [Klebsiella sp. BIGb0407]MCS3431109.1 two-component system capsular synthesis sensor histidine kinase RcsC [Klebsiella sp. BIGb0407]
MTFALALLLLWGSLRIIEQEKKRLVLDFSTLVSYAREQEKFLQDINDPQDFSFIAKNESVLNRGVIEKYPGTHDDYYSIPESQANMTYSWECSKNADCTKTEHDITPYGIYLSYKFLNFWSSSYFPSSSVWLISANDIVNIGVPALDDDDTDFKEELTEYQSVTKATEQYISQKGIKGCQIADDNNKVVWFKDENLSGKLLGIIMTEIETTEPVSTSKTNDCLYAVAVLDPQRINILERAVYPMLDSSFWLQRRDNFWFAHQHYGTLLGDGDAPSFDEQGMYFTTDGIVFKVNDDSENWTGYYLVSYLNFFQDNTWLSGGLITIILFSLFGSLAYNRWYTQRVIKPAQVAHDKLLESDEFSKTLIQTAPVAVCLLSRENCNVIFANELALEWLNPDDNGKIGISSWSDNMLCQVMRDNKAGMIEQLVISEALTVNVSYVPTRYKQSDVILCAFTDVSIHVETERHLKQARLAANEANEAKTLFLATMSHEIRTPLYGTLGTIELLSLTELNTKQRQYLNRIEIASQSLMQLISDILDISKIEANQLQLENIPFNPIELIQGCTGSYSSVAYNKGLLLFSIVPTDLPSQVYGDPNRLRQIINNLISNAIKFTDYGYVIVRLSQAKKTTTQSRLLIEVLDSGMGIAEEHLKNLFKPFFLINSENNISSGAGLGLFICSRLAGLMGSEMAVVSEPRIGSKFSVEIDFTLPDVSLPPAITPKLDQVNIVVRSPHPDLTKNIVLWLNSWGANAKALAEQMSYDDKQATLVDIQLKKEASPLNWEGQTVAISLSEQFDYAYNIDVHNIFSIGFGLEQFFHGSITQQSQQPVFPHFSISVLIAEDNPLNQITLKEQLELLGCAVTLASDGEEALALWDISPSDIIFTDVNMPYLNGYGLATKLRSEGVTVPIIGLTANAMLDEEKRCIESGMDAWLVKPIELKKLAEILRNYVGTEHLKHIDESLLALPGIDILTKHRDIFIQSMSDDLEILQKSIISLDVKMIIMTLHRMRGALVLANYHDLSLRLEVMGEYLESYGMDEKGTPQVNALVSEIQLLIEQ